MFMEKRQRGFDKRKGLWRERGGAWGGEREAFLQKSSLSPPQYRYLFPLHNLHAADPVIGYATAQVLAQPRGIVALGEQ